MGFIYCRQSYNFADRKYIVTVMIEKRIDALVMLGKYLLSDDAILEDVKLRAKNENAWFTLENIDLAIENIVKYYLQKDALQNWVKQYSLPVQKKKVGIVMAGNIPLVGFHDFLCGFISGHDLYLKLSSKDSALIKHLIYKLTEWHPEWKEEIHIADTLKNCDAYIATGSNNTARYFEQYFGKYPHIIRQNRTSVAVLDGNESEEDMKNLAKDVFSFYGLGCRNVTQICIPENYSFDKLLNVFSLYQDLMHHHKYKNNYDYYLAIYLLNKVSYLTNDTLLLVENELPFSAVSVLHYRFYNDKESLVEELKKRNDIQTIVGVGFTPFGTSQQPSLSDYADGVDTMAFLSNF